MLRDDYMTRPKKKKRKKNKNGTAICQELLREIFYFLFFGEENRELRLQ